MQVEHGLHTIVTEEGGGPRTNHWWRGVHQEITEEWVTEEWGRLRANHSGWAVNDEERLFWLAESLGVEEGISKGL